LTGRKPPVYHCSYPLELSGRVHMATLLEETRLAVSLPTPAARMTIRRRARVSRERMAAELECHPISVARWERGTRDPHGELRLRYARLLQLLDEVATAAEHSRRADAS
jgi:DNA-binding transcriptional regulator YiaG